jgi:DNA-binding beta-propeller fold protein YncE
MKGCAQGVGLLGAVAVAVSPNGQNVYVAGYDSDAVVAFSRDLSTGQIAEQNCVSANGTSGIDGTKGACSDGDALSGATAFAVSPDNAFVYAASDSAGGGIAIFSAGPKGLTQIGCVRAVRTCTNAFPLSSITQIAISPDGKNLYAVSGVGSNAVLSFARDVKTGLLTSLGCVSDDGHDRLCASGNALRGADAIVVSPDGQQVYVGTGRSDSVLTFNRDPDTGVLAQRGCVMFEAPRGGSCISGRGMQTITSLAVAPDGRTLYATAYESNAIAVFARTPSTGAIRWIGCESTPYDDEEKDGCGHGRQLNSPERIVLSKDGSRLSVTAGGGVTFLDRNAVTGALSVSGCVVSDNYYDDDVKAACQTVPGLGYPYDIALSPDERNVYVASYQTSSVATLAPSAALSQLRLSKYGLLSARVGCPSERTSPCAGALSVRAGYASTAIPYRVPPGTTRELHLRLRRQLLQRVTSAVVTATDGSRRLTPVQRLLRVGHREDSRARRPH